MSKNIAKLKRNLLGLEIGSSGIKIVEADFYKDELQVRNVVTNPLPENIYNDGNISDTDLVIKMIKQSLKKNKIRARNCFCSMNSSQVISREVTVPYQNKEHVDEMAKYEVEQYLPVDMENYTVQSVILREIELDDKPFAEMLVTAFPKNLIEQMHFILSKSGLAPLVLDTQFNAFTKLIENQSKVNGNYYHREGVCAFIDLGSESISVQIFKKGHFGFSQNIPHGGKDLDTNISKFLNVSVDEAMRMKMQIRNLNYAIDEMSEEAKLINVIKSTISNWLDDINKIFLYYRSRHTGNHDIEYIYLHGGLSNLPGISDFVESQFKIPTEKVKKVNEVTFLSQVDIADIMNTLGVFYRR